MMRQTNLCPRIVRINARWMSSENGKQQEQQQKDQAASVDEVTEEVDEAMAIKLQHADARIKELEDLLLRSYAERENIRKIGHNDVENAKKYSVRGLAKDMLDVADNLERALTTVKPEQLEAIPEVKLV